MVANEQMLQCHKWLFETELNQNDHLNENSYIFHHKVRDADLTFLFFVFFCIQQVSAHKWLLWLFKMAHDKTGRSLKT